MSGGLVCADPAGHRARWVVLLRRCNYSAFNGYRYTPRAYSTVMCPECDHSWRTRAAYVDRLPDLPPLD